MCSSKYQTTWIKVVTLSNVLYLFLLKLMKDFSLMGFLSAAFQNVQVSDAHKIGSMLSIRMNVDVFVNEQVLGNEQL